MDLKKVLEDIKNGVISIEDGEKMLKGFSYDDLGFAKIDNQRKARRGITEAVYCAGKTSEQILSILQKMIESGSENIVASRASEEQYDFVKNKIPCRYFKNGKIILANPTETEKKGLVAVVCAGTSDLPIAEEAAVTVLSCDVNVTQITDVGVAGLHRLLSKLDEIRKADCVIAIAGMEGALASVLAGLVSVPVVAVPTSIGYGANFGGLSALLAMLNSCAEGVGVVNIDNGFGAATLAALIVKQKYI